MPRGYPGTVFPVLALLLWLTADEPEAWFRPTMPVRGPDVALELLARAPLDAPEGTRTGRDRDALQRIDRVAFAPDGRVLVQDRADGDVHVFAADGARLFVLSPPLRRGYALPGLLAGDAAGRVVAQWRSLDLERRELGLQVYDAEGAWSGTWPPPGIEPWNVGTRLDLLQESEGCWIQRPSGEIERLVHGRVDATLPQRPDGWSWRNVRLVADPEGGLVVIDAPESPPAASGCGLAPRPEPWRRTSDPSPETFVFVFEAEGDVWRRFRQGWWPLRQLDAGVGWLCSRDEDGRTWILDLSGDHAWRVRDDVGSSRWSTWGFPGPHRPDELWCVDPEARTLSRFALPARRVRDGALRTGARHHPRAFDRRAGARAGRLDAAQAGAARDGVGEPCGHLLRGRSPAARGARAAAVLPRTNGSEAARRRLARPAPPGGVA